MADTVKKIDYFYAEIPDRPGEGFRVLGQLKEAGVSLLNCTAFPTGGGKAQICLCSADGDSILKAAKGAGLKLSTKKRAFFIQGSDRAGAAAEILKKLGDAKINVTACNGSSAHGGG